MNKVEKQLFFFFRIWFRSRPELLYRNICILDLNVIVWCMVLGCGAAAIYIYISWESRMDEYISVWFKNTLILRHSGSGPPDNMDISVCEWEANVN